ncbi:hypothetical protein [Marinobacter zhejiangensis]|uniref:Uncharacterized protein n=1 Tax=Marinobacter zhejiangensis TaxID=488535 RepID=A0A1I4RZ67_9GAMM|nr:hypothetical protein [Marinobacter zhejiangensis]SFM57270.1 hypothetical protein SAMN04487963_3027 [Marinobacter zhejiangensis]
MDYANGVQHVLLRKIHKAEKEVMQLKLDYCRFVFGLSHRSSVVAGGKVFRVSAVDVESMKLRQDGTYTKPSLSGVPAEPEQASESVEIGNEWTLASEGA